MAKITKDDNDPVVLKNIKFLVNTLVYLRTDSQQKLRIVAAVHLTPNGYLYELGCGDEETSTHYDVEITTTKYQDIEYNEAEGDD